MRQKAFLDVWSYLSPPFARRALWALSEDAHHKAGTLGQSGCHSDALAMVALVLIKTDSLRIGPMRWLARVGEVVRVHR